MSKKILAMSLALVVALSFSACVDETEEAAGLPSAQEIVDGLIEAWDDIRTVQFDMDMTLEIAGEAKGRAVEATMATNTIGTVDLENRQMSMDRTMKVAMSGEGEMKTAMEMYLIGDMIYLMMEVSGTGPRWMKSEMPERYWEEIGQIEGQIELLKTARVRVIGSETVRGVDCYVLQVTPDMERLWQLAMQQAQVPGGEMPEVAEEVIKEMFRSYSVKQWIAKDTYFLTKAEIDIDMELTPEAMGFPGEEGVVTWDIAISLFANNYNQPVSIVLPPEAEEAIEVPQGTFR